MKRTAFALMATLLMSAFAGGSAQSQNLTLDSPGLPALPQSQDKLPDTAHPYFTYKPYPGPVEDTRALADRPGPPTTIPLSSLTFKASKDGRTYTDVIVGRSPLSSPRVTTSVNVMIVPLVFNIEVTPTAVFSTIVANSCGTSKGHTDIANFVDSPIIKPVTFDGSAAAGHAARMNGFSMGTGTYNDEFRRAEFLSFIGGVGSPYHTAFNVTQHAAVGINVASSVGTTNGSGCGRFGEVSYTAWDAFVQATLLPFVKATPSTFVVFLAHDVVLFDNTLSNCCILGYHGAESNDQTYGFIDYDTTGRFSGVSDSSVAAHEVGEWLDDPFGNNPTPAWGHIGQVSQCQGNWEVGDPLSGTLFPKILGTNGVTFSAQELAFWGWYYSADHDANFKVGAAGFYSNNATFKGPSKVCPPGGTFTN